MQGLDQLAVVTFDDRVEVAHRGPVVLKDLFDQQVDRIDDGGSTNLSGGMFQGFAELRTARERLLQDSAGGVPRLNRVLLLTDGLANVGLTDPAQLAARVATLREEGFTLSALGVGADFDEDMLAGLARAGGGNFYYIAGAEAIPAIFAQELKGLQSVVGQGLRLRVTPGPGVRITDAVGYPSQTLGDAVEFDIPDIYRGEEKVLAVRLGLESLSGGAHTDEPNADGAPAGASSADGAPAGARIAGEPPAGAPNALVRVELSYEETEGGVTVRIGATPACRLSPMGRMSRARPARPTPPRWNACAWRSPTKRRSARPTRVITMRRSAHCARRRAPRTGQRRRPARAAPRRRRCWITPQGSKAWPTR